MKVKMTVVKNHQGVKRTSCKRWTPSCIVYACGNENMRSSPCFLSFYTYLLPEWISAA